MNAAKLRVTADRLLEEGRAAEAAQQYERGLRSATSPLDRFQLANGLGNAQQRLGRLDEAATTLRQALQIATTLDDPYLHAAALNNLGYTVLLQGDATRAAPLLTEAGALFDGVAPASPAALECLDNVVMAQTMLKEYEAALATAALAWTLAERLGRGEQDRGERFYARGVLRAQLGRNAEARSDLEQGLGVLEPLGSPHVADLLGTLGDVLQAVGDHAGAARCYERALRL